MSLRVAWWAAGSPAGDHHCPASSRALPGSGSTASEAKAAGHTGLAKLHSGAVPGRALVRGWDPQEEWAVFTRPTPVPPLGYGVPPWGTQHLLHTSASPNQDISPAFEGCCLQQSRGKWLGELLGQADQRGGHPQYLLEICSVPSALNRETSTSTKHLSLIRTHHNNHPPCDK